MLCRFVLATVMPCLVTSHAIDWKAGALFSVAIKDTLPLDSSLLDSLAFALPAPNPIANKQPTNAVDASRFAIFSPDTCRFIVILTLFRFLFVFRAKFAREAEKQPR